ncbi:MAG: [Fe-Fe] hydrogenase large subunit C-terminal domain-containing protein [Bacteroidales bacterium]|nr:[Fe-Fe] hydrogenase large subunit C-terminal domain-containing protein [Bacteroidales bacterium]
MVNKLKDGLVYTLKDRCRVCYTCVRECPVKAIKIINGQAEVISSRCIGCGNCTRVCSQSAKKYIDHTLETKELLNTSGIKVACLAPSFAAEFTEIIDYKMLISMIKQLGFDYVMDVSFGADLVAHEYNKIYSNKKTPRSISTDCPAIGFFVRHYYPELVDALAPLVSPMVAMVKVAKKLYGEDIQTVFIGPCIAKKAESSEVDIVLTFKELRNLFKQYNLNAEELKKSDFDGPIGNKSSLFPINRGKLHAVGRADDLKVENIIVTSGHDNFKEAIKEFKDNPDSDLHLELLCCEGCILGPGMTKDKHQFQKTLNVKRFVKEKVKKLDLKQWEADMNTYLTLDLSQQFSSADRRIPLPSEEEIQKVLVDMGKISLKDHLNCGACGYNTCIDHAVAIIEGLAESEMCLPYTIEKLHKSIKELNISNDKLVSAQQTLMQTERLANMGQLSAGIAHELNNPLGVITMYSNILFDEIKDESVRNDLKLIAEQANRCKSIVGGLLNFARKNQVRYKLVNIEEFVKNSLDSIIASEKVKITFKSNLIDKMMEVDADQWLQVITNLEKNAVEAMGEQGGELKIILDGDEAEVEFVISDTGCGIAKENMDKIYTPFFTTKPIGKGTGLGLPLIYGIVKMHRGQIHIETNADKSKGPTGTTFKIKIPRKKI